LYVFISYTWYVPGLCWTLFCINKLEVDIYYINALCISHLLYNRALTRNLIKWKTVDYTKRRQKISAICQYLFKNCTGTLTEFYILYSLIYAELNYDYIKVEVNLYFIVNL
jgi:hypothetical protein